MAIEIKLSTEALESIGKLHKMILDFESVDSQIEFLLRRIERVKQNAEEKVRRYELIIDDYARKVAHLQQITKKKTEWIEEYQSILGNVREDFNRVSDQLNDAKQAIAIQENTISRHVDTIVSLRESLDSVRIQRDAAQAENQKLFEFFGDEGYDISEVLYG